MMEQTAEQSMVLYSNAYLKLYNRRPKDLRALDNGWVIVNGARMQVSELDYLITQLMREYSQGVEQKRRIVNRLLKWFKQN